MSANVLCFGELMLRLAPPSYERLLQSPHFEATFGGGEANVAVSLSRLGMSAGFVSKLPANPVGDAAVGELRKHGVDVTHLARGGSRVGIYYCEKGASQRASKVVYDRAHSSIAEASGADFAWSEIFSKAKWFHTTGITPALSASCAAITLDAVKAAKAAGLTVSCDLNYRKNLWTSAEAGACMRKIMPFVDLIIANEEDAEKVFGIKAPSTDVNAGSLSHEGYSHVAQKLHEEFGAASVAITLRSSRSASDNGWAGLLWREGKSFFSKSYDVHIVDRVGGGDSFGAGLIYAMNKNMSAQDCIEFAVAASCLKHSIEGDFNLATLDEIQTLMKGDGSGRVQR